MASVQPVVTILMPVQDCGGTLEPAVRSILLQTFDSWELLLIDDGSTDNTLKIAEGFSDPRVRIFADGRRLGLSKRLNQAIGIGRGQYFARMDGDDVSYPGRLDAQVAFLEANRGIDLVGSLVLVFRSTGIPIGKRAAPASHAQICARPFSGFPLAHPRYCGRRDWFLSHGYAEQVLKGADQIQLLRSFCSSRFANIPDILLGYREDRIGLSGSFRARWAFARYAIALFLRSRKPLWALRAGLGQASKAVVDLFAVASGLGYTVLRHRARPLTTNEVRRWNEVWRAVEQGTGAAHG